MFILIFIYVIFFAVLKCWRSTKFIILYQQCDTLSTAKNVALIKINDNHLWMITIYEEWNQNGVAIYAFWFLGLLKKIFIKNVFFVKY